MTKADQKPAIDFWQDQVTTPCQTINLSGVEVTVKRDDLSHPVVQGNKLRKLKYNLLAAQHQNAKVLITFGGAYSNHLLATAFASQAMGIHAIGVVRGDELANQPDLWSKTLLECRKLGMRLVFVSRSEYRLKNQSQVFQLLIQDEPSHYVLPEGGSNSLALVGMAELIDELNEQLPTPPTHIFCPVGTGGTVAGIIKGVGDKKWRCKVFGVVVLKGVHSVNNDVYQWLKGFKNSANYELSNNYHCGGYAKNNPQLIEFSIDFNQQHQIPLDKIYNAKSFYALYQMIQSGEISTRDRPLIIHTGGLQGGLNH